jgi:hypothetical protein
MADDTAPPSLPRKGGRPPAREPGSSVSTWLPTREHDRLIREALRRDESLSALVRRILTSRRGR